MWLNQGYPLTLEEQCEIAMPVAGQTARLPAVCGNDTEPLKWKMQWEASGPGRLKATFQVQLTQGDLEEKEAALLKTQLQGLYDAFAREAVFETGKR